MSRLVADRAGRAFGNILLVLATLAVLAAVLYPRLSDRAFAARVDAVAADVERLRVAVADVRGETGTWPATGPAESIVPDLGGSESGEAAAEAPHLTWRRLAAVEVPEPSTELADSVPEALDQTGQEIPVPEPVFYHRGAISVQSNDRSLLGALMDRYPGSFVHDGVWTLPLPRVQVPEGT